MLYELPWLLNPTEAQRKELKSLREEVGGDDLERLARISGLRWSTSELSSIGRKLEKILAEFGSDWRNAASGRGFLPFSLLLVFTNTATQLKEALMAVALTRGIFLKCEIVEYREPEAWLSESGNRLSESRPDAVMISLDGAALQLNAAIGDMNSVALAIQAALDRVVAINKAYSELIQCPVIVQNLPADPNDPQSSIDAWLPGSPGFIRSEFNRALAMHARSEDYVLFDAAGIADLVGQDAWYAGRYWYAAKLPFSLSCIPLYATRLVGILASLRGKSRRVLVLDLDNTLWGGIIGDDGLDGIVLGGVSALGGAHSAIQKMARHYRSRGIVLCVSSKNTREIALDAFRRHPEMLLRESDIALFEINWNNKADSIRVMAETLDLGLESFVFIDDNPAERKQVRDALPAVAVPELPADPSSWIPIIQAAAYFEQTSISEEDLKRTEYYRENVQRAAIKKNSNTEGAFLESLEMIMTVQGFNSVGRKRIAQLISKSNQFNLTTRRYSEAEVASLESDSRVMALQVRLKDVFGDNGMISVVICRKERLFWEIDTWLMSCRVLGRCVEQAVLEIIVEAARTAGVPEIRGRYIPTPKNGIVSEHYTKLGFREIPDGGNGHREFLLKVDEYRPPHVPIEVLNEAGS